MAQQKQSGPGFVVLRHDKGDRWRLLGEVKRKRGLPARAARSQAILDATNGAAKAGESYAAILRSEWRVSMDWQHPSATQTRRGRGTTKPASPTRRRASGSRS